MSNKLLGALLLLGGAALLVLTLFADVLGIGVATDPPAVESESRIFGWKQIIGVIVGAVLVVAGLVTMGRPRRSTRSKPVA